MYDGAEVEFLGGEEGKTLLQVEAHLVSENAQGTGSGAIILFRPMVQDVVH